MEYTTCCCSKIRTRNGKGDERQRTCHAVLFVQVRLQIEIYFTLETSIMIEDRANQAFWYEARST